MDCLIIGFKEPSLEKTAGGYEKMQRHTGAYRHFLQAVPRVDGTWMHYTHILNDILGRANGKPSGLHLMKMPNLAVCYLKSFLVKRGLNVESINYFNEEQEQLEMELSRRPLAVALTTTYYVSYEPVAELVQFVRTLSPESIIILGGPYVNTICLSSNDATTQDFMFNKIGAHIYVTSFQGEHTLFRAVQELRNCESPSLGRVPNLIFRKELLEKSIPEDVTDGTYVRTVLEKEDNDLSSNVIDWSLFPPSLYVPTTLMRTSRGCPFECAFCSFPTNGGTLNYSTLDAVQKEMIQLREAGVINIIFIDDSFNVPLDRFKSLLRMMIAEKFRFQWVCYFRCSHADDETFDLMKKSGCIGVFLGIESGDQSMLDRMNKKVKIEKYSTGIAKLNERGIFTFVSLIVGFPGESEQSVTNSINFIEECKPTFYKAELYFHSHSVPVHRQAEELGITGSGYGWSHNTMDWKVACDQLERMYMTIKGSLICPVYMFDFWAIPYLMGNGIDLSYIKEYLKMCRPLLLKNFSASHTADSEADYSALNVLGKEIARNCEYM